MPVEVFYLAFFLFLLFNHSYFLYSASCNSASFICTPNLASPFFVLEFFSFLFNERLQHDIPPKKAFILRRFISQRDASWCSHPTNFFHKLVSSVSCRKYHNFVYKMRFSSFVVMSSNVERIIRCGTCQRNSCSLIRLNVKKCQNVKKVCWVTT